MSWSYSQNPSSSKIDEVRYLIGDIDQFNPILTNEEIDFALIQNSQNTNRSAIQCIDIIVTRICQDGEYKMGNVTIDTTSVLRNYESMRKNLINRMNSVSYPIKACSKMSDVFNNWDK